MKKLTIAVSPAVDYMRARPDDAAGAEELAAAGISEGCTFIPGCCTRWEPSTINRSPD
jgi:hypothetical protein